MGASLRKIWLASLHDFVLNVSLDVHQPGRPKQFWQMICDLVIPVVRLPPTEKCSIENLELCWGIRLPFVLHVVVIENQDDTGRFGRFLHIRHGQARFSNPLERWCGGHNIELRAEIEVRCIAQLKAQVWKGGMFLARKLKQRRIAIHADDISLRPNRFRDSRSDGSRSTTNVQHSNIRRQQCRKTAVVRLKRAAPQNAGIRLMGLSRHIGFNFNLFKLHL